MGYSPTGPFTDNAAPPLSATYNNNIENFLETVNSAATDSNISSDGSGNQTVKTITLTVGSLTRIAISGPYSTTNSPANYNHNLGTTPSFIIPILGVTTPGNYTVSYNFAGMNSTQVSMESNATITNGVYILAIKL